MSNLKDYIKQKFGLGVQKPQIEAELLKAGWTKDQIETVFDSIEFEQKQFIEKQKRHRLPSKRILTAFVLILFCLSLFFHFFIYIDLQNGCNIKIIPSLGEWNNLNIKRAIKVLKYGSPEDYQKLCKYVNTIEGSVSCGGWEGGCFPGPYGPKSITVSSAQDTVAWSASVITHETCHAIQWDQLKALDETECYQTDDRFLQSIVQY